MSNSAELHAYRAFGCSFLSRGLLPELARAHDGASNGGIQINWGDTPAELPQPCIQRGGYQASSEALLLTVPDVARYHVTKDSITVTPDAVADENSVRLYLFGSAIGALLHLNGILALHGSSVRIKHGSAAVFCGVSTAGKSTLAASLSQRGFHHLADDIVAVHFDTEGQAWVHPGLSRSKLWSETLALLGMSSDAGKQVRHDLDKYSMPVETWPHAEPLTRIYELLPVEEGEVSMAEVKGMEKLRLLDRQTFRPSYLEDLGLKSGHLRRLSQLAPKVLMRQIVRPRCWPTLTEMVDALKADWA